MRLSFNHDRTPRCADHDRRAASTWRVLANNAPTTGTAAHSYRCPVAELRGGQLPRITSQAQNSTERPRCLQG